MILEIIGTICNLLFLILLMRNIIWAWPFGIIGSGIMAFQFYQANLIAEPITYLVYVVLGFYGWYYWAKGKLNNHKPIIKWSLKKHSVIVLAGIILAFISGYFIQKNFTTDVAYFDSFTTVFALLATVLEARKVLSSWIYWILINIASAILYQYKTFDIYTLLMITYVLLSVIGYFSWKSIYKSQLANYAKN